MMKLIQFSATNQLVIFFAISVGSLIKASAQTENTFVPSASKQFDCSQPSADHKLCPQISYKYVGCSASNKFHRPGCIFAKAISSRHLVLFQWRKQAIAAQFQPCGYCLPPVWLSTHCVILPLNSSNTSSNQKAPDNKASGPIQKNRQRQEAGNGKDPEGKDHLK
jgi:hypothetical protein